ncbi:putative protein NAP1 [Drosera capensis]
MQNPTMPSQSTSTTSTTAKPSPLSVALHLTDHSHTLLAKLYHLLTLLYPSQSSHSLPFPSSFHTSNIFPNFPKLCLHLSKQFPLHTSKINIARIDAPAFESLSDGTEMYAQNLEPWVELMVELMTWRERAVRVLLEMSGTVLGLSPGENGVVLGVFMDLFVGFVRVGMMSGRLPRKMIVQVYNVVYGVMRDGRDFEEYGRLVEFVGRYDSVVKGLQEDLGFVSPRIGEVLEAVGPVVFLSTDTKKIRNEGFLSPFHPRYPDILTNSAHPMRAQELANVTSYREWVLLGYLVCPDELLRVTSIDIALVVLKENLVLPLFRDEYVLLHEEYQLYVLPRILETKRLAKAGRSKQKEADLVYSVAKQVEKVLSEVHEQALLSCDSIHHERRILLKQEIGRMVLFFSDQPSLLAPNIQMVFSALALAQSEVTWYFQHVGIASSKSKAGNRVVTVEIVSNNPFLLFLGLNLEARRCDELL